MNLKNALSILALASFGLGAQAGLTIDLNKDKESIKAMTGCYEIVFQSAETFAYDRDYEHYPRYRSGALEWIFVDSEVNTKDEQSINMQHLLITPGDMIVKHWRQKWDYQASHALDFGGFSNWTKKEVSDKSGTWVQRVYQVDDSPRYECSAPWIHTSKKSYWECDANAPLPRREFSVREDYNILRRGNRHELTPYGHVHDQNNIKISRSVEGVEKKIAMEKSYNTYRKVADSKCQPAIDWWKTHKNFWRDAQGIWEEVLYTNQSVKLDFNKYGSKLWMKLFMLDEKLHANGPYSSDSGRAQIKSIITDHIVD
ncbi:DUF6607 family protein [Bacteriovorax sp. DB6_IX]|uniref:DUF6607 family protein n=1 Tax=Bacteriovorax sp. DB6_IX TaxID=1353530 RepID=UPI000389F7BA|nr:DUF6607 family protein [Bacteriovorax sp. DB6_IX]EQC50469.1 hypothetical protein M901_2358 [Bacteriovorax sp. DB6_IX]